MRRWTISIALLCLITIGWKNERAREARAEEAVPSELTEAASPRPDDPESTGAACRLQLRKIAHAMAAYMRDDRMRFPPDLGALVAAGADVSLFVCPASSTKLPPEIAKQDRDEQAAWVNTSGDYMYVGSGLRLRDVTDKTVILYEPLDRHATDPEDGINVLYGDFHVEFHERAEAEQIIARVKAGENPMRARKPAPGPQLAEQRAPKAFFTTDDGQTWFTDDATRLPPFEKDGIEAVRAHVFSCDGEQFVQYLERFTPDARKKLDELRATAGADPLLAEAIFFTGIEVKKPGQKEWIKQADERAVKVMMPDCNGKLEVVTPR